MSSGVDHPDSGGTPVVRLRGAGMRFGDHVLWEGLDLDVRAGQFLAILGPNGGGKSTLLRVLLGQQRLTTGTVEISGAPVRRGSERIGLVPQRTSVETASMVKARDVVRLGVDGHRWGLPAVGRRGRTVRHTVDRLLTAVDAAHLGEAPISMLSGGETQRIRVAAALASDPDLLLCDEPLAALDLRHQQEVGALIDRIRRDSDTTVLFVTHDINVILDYVDQVLYLANGRFSIGPPDQVLTTQGLSALYGSQVDVLRVGGRIVVLGAGSTSDLVSDDAHHDQPGGVR